jgi:hypothetical protein
MACAFTSVFLIAMLGIAAAVAVFRPRHQGEAVGSPAGSAGCSVWGSSGRLTAYVTLAQCRGAPLRDPRAPADRAGYRLGLRHHRPT